MHTMATDATRMWTAKNTRSLGTSGGLVELGRWRGEVRERGRGHWLAKRKLC